MAELLGLCRVFWKPVVKIHGQAEAHGPGEAAIIPPVLRVSSRDVSAVHIITAFSFFPSSCPS